MSMKASSKSPQQTIVRAVEAQPHLDLDKGQETQPWRTLTDLPIALDEQTRMQSIEALNQLLADTITLRDMYKKHHWQVSGPTFYQLHLLFDAHYEAQAELVDTIAERIMSLGGVSVAMAHDVAEMTMLRRPPKGRETPAMQITRLVEAHRHILADPGRGRGRGGRGRRRHERPSRQRCHQAEREADVVPRRASRGGAARIA